MRRWDCEAGLGGDLAEDRDKINSRKVGLKTMPVSELGWGWGVMSTDEWNTPRVRQRLLVDLFPDWRLDYTPSLPSQAHSGQTEAACECLVSCMALAVTSASKGPHPQGDRAEPDTPGFDI